jgi:uncharacterized protein (DUF2062 family)
MFNRQNKLSFGLKILRFFWPSSGLKRAGKYLLHRLSRLPGTPYTLAAGFACGAAVSFTPFVGFHLILAALIAWLTRAGILASAIGTSIGNPWTFPFIWIWIYNLGNWMGFGSSSVNVADLHFPHLFGQLTEALLNGDFSSVVDISGPVLWPMFIGCIPSAFCIWIIFYFPLNRIVESYQKRRRNQNKIKESQFVGDPK